MHARNERCDTGDVYVYVISCGMYSYVLDKKSYDFFCLFR